SEAAAFRKRLAAGSGAEQTATTRGGPAMKWNDTLPVSLHRLERPSWLPESTWPFDTSGLDVDDSVIAVSETGQGPVLLFVHVGTRSFILAGVVTGPAPGFRFLFFDSPPSGQ